MIRKNDHRVFHCEECQGFTLIEVMVALVIFSVGILAILGGQVSSIRGNMNAQSMSEGANIGSNIVEELISKPYASADLRNGSHGPVYHDNGKYQVDWSVSTNSDFTKSINITIEWSDGRLTRQVGFDLIKPQDI
jgi:type IV pilus assembly protein PilV